MATFTENYGLIKPGLQDYYDVADFNDNMDMIDGTLADMESINDKIGNPEDTETNTIFGKLNNGNSSIKSLQKIHMTGASSKDPVTRTLEISVTPEKCIVLVDNLHADIGLWIDYTLNSDRLTATIHGNGISVIYSVLFQIIELN